MKIKSAKDNLSPVDWKEFDRTFVAGVDEVGRGCLAGPVFAAAVCFKEDLNISGLTDSKLISEAKRELIAEQIKSKHWFGIGIASVEEIDEINILQASFLAMRRALKELEKSMNQQLELVLVDGHLKIPALDTEQVAIVKGDLRCSPISAASIVAKVERDHLMAELGKEFGQYGFEKHKGYAAPLHKAAIAKFGPSRFHRKTFSGVKEFL